MSLNRIFIIAGDASGDVHGSYVVRRLQETMPHLNIEGIGGTCMAKTGVNLFHSQEKMGVFGMGVLSAIPSHYLLGKRLLDYFRISKPDAVLLIDYGMFNLWIAKEIKRLGLKTKVFYYVPPQVWASRIGRIHKIKQYVDHVFCIFPFEKPLYESYGIPVTFVGHPLMEQLPPPPDREAFCREHDLNPEFPIIGLFPGSRRSEIKGLLHPMIQALPVIEQSTGQKFQFLLAKSPAISEEVFDVAFAPVKAIAENHHFKILENQNHQILALSQAALVASGTVTLEAALYQTPVVISYKISRLAYAIFRRFAYVSQIGLPNLLSGCPDGFLPELMMDKVTPAEYAKAILPYLSDSPEREQAMSYFNHIKTTLGEEPASINIVRALSVLMDQPIEKPISKEVTSSVPVV